MRDSFLSVISHHRTEIFPNPKVHHLVDDVKFVRLKVDRFNINVPKDAAGNARIGYGISQLLAILGKFTAFGLKNTKSGECSIKCVKGFGRVKNQNLRSRLGLCSVVNAALRFPHFNGLGRSKNSSIFFLT
jgi:hypothetical protein